jgi:hypothetical protein
VPGLLPARLTPQHGQGRSEPVRIVPAELVEPGPLRAVPVGDPVAWPGTVAFLDGTQRYQVAGYAGAAPLIVAEVAAAVRERVNRELGTVVSERRRLLLGRPEALDLLGAAGLDAESVALESDQPVHPLGDLELARVAVDNARAELERRVGQAYRERAAGWLVVDGSLAESPLWARDPGMVGVSRSHATLPFDGEDLVRYLHLPAGHRSSVFQPGSSRRAPVYSWALRLWDWAGRDLLYGLVRVDVAATAESLAKADELSRWLLAERAPLAGVERWDRVLYGIHSVGEYLSAGAPSA